MSSGQRAIGFRVRSGGAANSRGMRFLTLAQFLEFDIPLGALHHHRAVPTQAKIDLRRVQEGAAQFDGMEKSNLKWHEETGHVSQAMLAKHIGDLTIPIYYIAGPRGMVAALHKTLNESGVNDDNIRTEEFSGY